ncbi:MAG: serine/threonine-protein kinase [bacterium]|nr:serine/threonine-protein kinase [bacterium]
MAKIKLQGEEEKRKNIYYEVDTAIPPIGEGGMGKVMKGKCVDIATGVSRPVAIKFLYDDLPAHAIERARREAAIQLRNDNLIEMLGFIETETGSGENARRHYHVVSELLHGVSLSDIFEGRCTDKAGQEIPFAAKMLKDNQTDSVHFAKVIVKNVLSGLVALHDAGYVHRDIDPSNIMLTEEGRIKLIDFGIAKQVSKLTTHDRSLTTAGVFMGKAEYAAPELALGDLQHQNQTTDIYAIGILLYQCIVGHVPFEGPAHEVLEAQIKKKIKLSNIKDKGVKQIIRCATDKNQKVRYQSASQMRVAMEKLDGQKMQMKASKKIAITAAAAVIVLAVVGAIGYSHHKKQVAEEQLLTNEIAKNDSIAQEIEKWRTEADMKYEIGKRHGEGYEQEFIAAYASLKKAIQATKKLTKPSVNLQELTTQSDSVKNALLAAKAELDDKATYFTESDMEDVAVEFRNRSEKITQVLK